MKCPSLENLIAYVEPPPAGEAASGEGAGALASAVAAHLASGCAGCAAQVEWYKRVTTIAATDDTVEPPPWVLKRALKLFEPSAPAAVRPPDNVVKLIERLGRLVAALVFDSAAQTSIAGARSVGIADRQMLYRAEAYHIDLQFATNDGERAALTGQILRDGEFAFESVAGLELSLLREGRKVSSTLTNRFGEFSIAQLEHGHYDLRIEAVEFSITVVGLPVA